MATYNKYEIFVKDLIDGVHDFTSSTGDTFKVGLTNTAPVAGTNALRADTTELATAGGYTSGGVTVPMATSRAGATSSAVATDPGVPTWTGTGSGFTFAHVFLYNDTSTEGPVDPLVAYWSYGSSQLVAAGETLTVDFGAALFTIT